MYSTLVASNIIWITAIVVLSVLLLIVTILLIMMCGVYCQKLSVIKRMTTAADNKTLYHDTVKNPPVIKPSHNTVATLEHNPAYGGVESQPKRKRQINDYCDYVVSDDEMIETDHNPSYVTTTVGGNELQDNPSYQPAFVAVV